MFVNIHVYTSVLVYVQGVCACACVYTPRTHGDVNHSAPAVKSPSYNRSSTHRFYKACFTVSNHVLGHADMKV